jgi:MSHA biogenesis protein MshJ
MKTPPALTRAVLRFDQLSIRERALVVAATLGALLMIWQVAIMDRVSSRQFGLRDEMTQLQESIATTTAEIDIKSGASQDQRDQEKLKELEDALTKIDAELTSKSAGLIPPDRMVQVIHDVLRHQQGLRLVSLHNQPVMPLNKMGPQPAPEAASARQAIEANSGDEAAEPNATEAQVTSAESSGPYVHPVELVLEGSYLDVLRYLQALEALPWRFYWKALDLQSTGYPVNRVRIELTTLSMDKEWVGV